MRRTQQTIRKETKLKEKQDRWRTWWLRIAAVLLCLIAIGSIFVISSHEKIEQWEYPRKYSDLVEYYAGKYDLDERMLYSIIRTESNFDPQAQSNVDARGLMQITEITFDWIKSKIAPSEELTFDDLYDPETNIRFGTYYFSYCLQRYGNDLATAAAAYHSGWGTVDSLLSDSQYSQDGVTLDSFPYTQMQRYVYKVTSAYERYCEIYAD
ncbi:lytic transglycosylase domain-containing protein [Subdoligranulum sp. DSM 109015]|uniref:Lytic transglycosylase domain-containing protein n=1 Tax=Gemmiger gallinarum TaxID=2779354 RepID=A0ABR9R066_9FIRM|nr:lytic transglycosylase domain-containing protein [Gemmiger gallinarum]MBE5036510.1 lytic transglycosylase domain-containing protein [Gemmiger gallinarum]